jgi:transcriptional regulator with XRE-family HTH domain
VFCINIGQILKYTGIISGINLCRNKVAVKMLLKSQQPQSQLSREAESLLATIAIFKINTTELAARSGVNLGAINRFLSGDGGNTQYDLTGTTLSQLMAALGGNELLFYSQMLIAQNVVSYANLELPLLDFGQIDADVHRQAFELTIEVFGETEARLAQKSGLYTSNITRWKKGRRESSIASIFKLKEAMTLNQRCFLDAMITSFSAIINHRKTSDSTSPNPYSPLHPMNQLKFA